MPTPCRLILAPAERVFYRQGMGGMVARGFAVEADMLALIAAAVQDLAGPGAVAVFEVQAAAGVPDVVAAVFDGEVLRERAADGFVTDASGLGALLALSDANAARRSLDARQVAEATGL